MMTMTTFDRLSTISNRLEQLQALSEWVTKEMVHYDNCLCQTSTLITVLAEDVQEQLLDLVRDFEEREKRYIQ